MEKLTVNCVVETCNVQDARGEPVPAHRVKATREDAENEITVFIGGNSAARADEYARARYHRRNIHMHCDPLNAKAIGDDVGLGR